MSYEDLWDQLHDKYLESDWIDKPSLFAQWAVSYFHPVGAVLELGAGQAQDSRFFDKKNYRITATDFSPHALELAKQKSSTSITFRPLDLSKPLPFSDATYEVVYAHLSLHYFSTPDTVTLFQEIWRVLKPGGILATLFNSTSDPEMTQGRAIEEPDYREVDSLPKRYFNVASARKFAKDFEIMIVDDQGTTYKDSAKGISNLIRLVAKKQA